MTAQRYFRVPKERSDDPGMFCGGAWIGFAKASPTGHAVAAVPAAGDYSWAMPGWVECAVTGDDLQPEHIPTTAEAEAALAAAGTPGESGGENGASGEAGGASETDPK